MKLTRLFPPSLGGPRLSATVLMLSGLILLAGCGQGEGETIQTEPYAFEVSDGGAHLVLRGTWRLNPHGKTLLMPEINSVLIECDRQDQTCEEDSARLIQASDDPTGQSQIARSLHSVKQSFQVVEWSETGILARTKTWADETELKISLTEKTAERTLHRGSGETPQVYRWVLE